MLMLGNQIYADDLNLIGPDISLNEFNTRYQLAFSQEGISNLMCRIPTYMMLDEHEIQDNWTQDRLGQNQALFAAAIHAYSCYQWIRTVSDYQFCAAEGIEGQGVEDLDDDIGKNRPAAIWVTPDGEDPEGDQSSTLPQGVDPGHCVVHVALVHRRNENAG